MAKLILKKFRCIEETDEVDSDSPYFAVFVGDPSTKASTVHLVRREAWDNETDSGETKVANITVASNVDNDAVVLAALLEEDDDADVTGGNMTLVRNWMQAVFTAFAVNGLSPSQIAGKVSPEFRRALNIAIANDELIGIKRVGANPGTKVVNYKGDGGNYDVTFSVA
jgi:hypothetical protein